MKNTVTWAQFVDVQDGMYLGFRKLCMSFDQRRKKQMALFGVNALHNAYWSLHLYPLWSLSLHIQSSKHKSFIPGGATIWFPYDFDFADDWQL